MIVPKLSFRCGFVIGFLAKLWMSESLLQLEGETGARARYATVTDTLYFAYIPGN
jgi:hypothetical protein